MSKAQGRFIAIYCGLLMSIGAFSIDISLPAIPGMVTDLAAPTAWVQWTVTIYMFTGAFGQLLAGPASDRYGRKPVLLAGIAVYFAGAVLSALAPGVEWLLAGRALQGFGAAAPIVMSRAIIRDLYEGPELARNLAFATMFFALGPIIAPFAGSFLDGHFGWRAIFAALAMWAVALALMLAFIPETLKAPQRDALSPAVFAANTIRLLKHPQSRRFLLVSVAAMSAMLLIIASAAPLYEQNFGLTGLAFASYFALHGTGIVIGQWANRRLIPRAGVVRAAMTGAGVLTLAASLILMVAVGGTMTPGLLTGLLVLYATSYLIVYSNAAAMVLDPHGDIAGFSTALMGFMSQIGAATIVSVLVVFIGGGLIAWAAVLTVLCLVNLLLVGTWRGW
ncbi:MAG: multidrug effflux MFS transporter [Notoacmeibacter sp.]|nr:multidrug effflux MFS transporter [Notoacmeibacter sp.]MCC0033231.1 multidrug effflux MFS transporter [Brucellaceae bacterium]